MTECVDTDVVIVAFNSGRWLARAVASALAATGVARVIVMDNASSDGSLMSLPADARLTVLKNAANLGFAVAANCGCRAATAANMLILNPDCVLGQNDVRALIWARAKETAVGIMSAQLLNTDGSLQRQSLRRDPTPKRAIAESFGRHGAGIHIPAPAIPGLVEVEACSGALMLLEKSVFESLNGFDEGYFLHCEDLDLCRRIRQLKLRVLVDTRVQVVHDKGTSSSAVPRLVATAKYRGMLRYFEKFDATQTPMPLRWVVYFGAWLRYRMALLRS